MKEDILNGAGAAYDTLKEVGVLIEENKDAIEALEAIAGSVKSVNGVAPDENGNVQIEVSSGADLTGYATEEWVQEEFQPKGEYLTEVPEGYAKTADIPSRVSQLTNDKGYLTEHQDISGKLDVSALPSAINTALTQAKESGQFDGKDGHTPVKGEDYYTEADKAEIVEITKSSITPASIGATTLSEIQPLLDKKVNDFSIEIYNGTSGNPKPVRFASFNYSTCDSENGIAAKISLVSGHGNGSSYAFLEDAIIRVNHLGEVQVDNFKYYGTSAGTYDGANRQYGDIFWLVDETNKIVDFYCLMGQYARVYQTPWKRLTHSTGGTVTQYASCTVYSSGEKTWANNSDIALTSDINTVISDLDGKMAKDGPIGTGSLSLNRKSDTTIGENSVSIGSNTTASGPASHAEGFYTEASGNYSHAEGERAKATSNSSHAEGSDTEASGQHSHAEGLFTVASGGNSHAEGAHTTASGPISHTEGWGTIAASEYQHVQGKYNVADTANQYAHIVGNGDSDNSRANIHTISWNGDVWFKKDVYVGGSSKNNATKLAKISDLNRTSAVNVADINYTTLQARGTSLISADTIPAVNGAIAWTYE